MEPIVHGLIQKYAEYIQFERENFHMDTPRHRELGPVASPEFSLLDANGSVLGRWVGVTEAEELDEAMSAMCE